MQEAVVVVDKGIGRRRWAVVGAWCFLGGGFFLGGKVGKVGKVRRFFYLWAKRVACGEGFGRNGSWVR